MRKFKGRKRLTKLKQLRARKMRERRKKMMEKKRVNKR
jgi:hypothetical protein